MSDYFVIHNSDGDTRVQKLTERELLARLDDNYWGDVEYLSAIPNETDTNYWGGAVLIIQGNIAVPKAEEVITKYKIGK